MVFVRYLGRVAGGIRVFVLASLVVFGCYVGGSLVVFGRDRIGVLAVVWLHDVGMSAVGLWYFGRWFDCILVICWRCVRGRLVLCRWYVGGGLVVCWWYFGYV